MDQTFLEKQKTILCRKRDEYRGLAAGLRDGEPLPDRVRFKFHVLLPAVTRALEKIEDGEYSECDDCGEEIPLQRLALVPGAIRCVTCQAKMDTRSA